MLLHFCCHGKDTDTNRVLYRENPRVMENWPAFPEIRNANKLLNQQIRFFFTGKKNSFGGNSWRMPRVKKKRTAEAAELENKNDLVYLTKFKSIDVSKMVSFVMARGVNAEHVNGMTDLVSTDGDLQADVC